MNLAELNAAIATNRFYADCAKNRNPLATIDCCNRQYFPDGVLLYDMDSLEIYGFPNEEEALSFVEGYNSLSDEEEISQAFCAWGELEVTKPSISVRFTYEVYEPHDEEEDVCDADDRGFCDEDGEPLTDQTMKWKDIQETDVELHAGDNLSELLNAAISLGINEPSKMRVDSQTWFTTTDDEVDYLSGVRCAYSMHIKGLTTPQMQRVANCLKAGRLSDEDEEFFSFIG